MVFARSLSEASDDDAPFHVYSSVGLPFQGPSNGSTELMDVDSNDPSSKHYGAAQQHTAASLTLEDQADDEDEPIFIDTSCANAAASLDASDLDYFPSSSCSSGSPCSSVASLPLSLGPHPPEQEAQQFSTQKAVTELSAAIASGAGSISDYSPLREYQRLFNANEESHGELWR